MLTATELNPPSGNYHVGVLLRRLHEFVVHGLHRADILVDHRLHAAPAVAHVAQNAACEAYIGVGIHKYLYIHQVAQLLVLEDQDSVDDYHLGGFHGHRLVRAIVVDERIDGMRYRHIILERLDMVDQHVGIERLRVVVIEFGALLVREFRVGLIIVVMAQRRHVVVNERLLQSLYERAFARSRAARNTYYRHFHKPSL